MKKAFIVLLVLVMAFTFAGCKNKVPGMSRPKPVQILPKELSDPSGPALIVDTDGNGIVARSVEGNKPVFEEEHPAQHTADRVVKGTKMVVEAKPFDGYKFKKWTVNDKDYSTDTQITVTVDKDLNIMAYFDEK